MEKGLFLTPIRLLIVHPKANFKVASISRPSALADCFGHWPFSDKCNKVTRRFIIRKLGVDEGLALKVENFSLLYVQHSDQKILILSRYRMYELYQTKLLNRILSQIKPYLYQYLHFILVNFELCPHLGMGSVHQLILIPLLKILNLKRKAFPFVYRTQNRHTFSAVVMMI